MTDKTAKNFLYQGFGFPIELHNVKMLEIENELHPIIDVGKLADQTLHALSISENKLTGNQLIFIRTYLMLNGVDFDKILNVSKDDVKNWKSHENKPVNLPEKMEIDLKLGMISFLTQRNNEPKNNLLSSQGLFSTSQKKSPLSAEQDQQETPKKKKP